jgi:hypothetical protein
MKSFRINLRNVAIIACLAATIIFASCEKEEDPTSGAGDEFTIPDDGKVPSTVIPDEIRALLETNMPVYSGKTPPDIKGEYLADSKILTGSNYPPDEIGKSYLNQYIAFAKGTNGKIRYDAEERRFDLPVSDDSSDDVTVYLVGTGSQFTAYFIATGQTYEIYNKESTIISGTLTENGIEDFHLAFVMLEKGADPSSILVPVNTYRVFKENDALAVRQDWLSDKENRTLILNGADEAWTSAERNEAYVFTDIGTYTKYTLNNGIWSYSAIGSYKISGTSLTLNAVDYPFSITANSLKIKISSTEYTFARTKPFTAGQLDDALILPDGQAWIMTEQYGSSGYIFKADGTYGYYWGTWTLTSEGTWNTSGNSLIINQTGIGAQRYTYTVANGTLTIRNAFGDEYVYLQKSVPAGN